MKIKLYESKWDNKIKGELAINFYNNIEDANIEGVKDSSIKILEKCKEFFNLDDDEYIFNDIEALVGDFEEASSEEDLDELLDELYDFCDDYSILIDVREEPEDAEVFLDSDKDTGTNDKPEDSDIETDEDEIELEPIPVEEIDPKDDKK